MTRVTVSWKGLPALQSALKAVPAKTRQGALKGLEASGRLVENEAKRSILKGPKTGEIYIRGGVRHQASAPGEAPASDTGTLVRSIVSDLDRQNLEIQTSAGTVYAKNLEYGTRNMEARPFLQPALQKVKGRIKTVVRQFIEQEVKS